jgi:hypothetical protein
MSELKPRHTPGIIRKLSIAFLGWHWRCDGKDIGFPSGSPNEKCLLEVEEVANREMADFMAAHEGLVEANVKLVAAFREFINFSKTYMANLGDYCEKACFHEDCCLTKIELEKAEAALAQAKGG